MKVNAVPFSDHQQMAKEIHIENAKWWVDLLTGKALDRNMGEMLALVHSEVSEAWEGAITKALDDKLTDLEMFEVELADAAIRIYDILGAREVVIKDITVVRQKLEDNIAINLCWIHYHITQSLEGFRKSNPMKGHIGLITALYTIWDLAKLCSIDLFPIIMLKRAYNQQRADHKPENRILEDGKKF